jgi:uncharacterized membrane protein YphA (DoxX/SURF4 family)
MNGSIMTSQSRDCVSNNPQACLGRWLLYLFCRWLVGGSFLLAAVTKISEPLVFVERLELHSGLPLSLARAVGIYLPWLELTCGFCVVLEVAVREAAALLVGLLFMFLGVALLQPTTDCGCLVFPQQLEALATGPGMMMRNLVLILAALLVLKLDRRVVMQIGEGSSATTLKAGQTVAPIDQLTNS